MQDVPRQIEGQAFVKEVSVENDVDVLPIQETIEEGLILAAEEVWAG